jgi:hypothetical protein
MGFEGAPLVYEGRIRRLYGYFDAVLACFRVALLARSCLGGLVLFTIEKLMTALQ